MNIIQNIMNMTGCIYETLLVYAASRKILREEDSLLDMAEAFDPELVRGILKMSLK